MKTQIKNFKHGHSFQGKKTPEYKIWVGMKMRCNNPNTNRYHRYGGRGIKVCERWNDSFENFLQDMGPRPEGHSIDRYPDNDGNYEPGNCRWATRIEQANNRLPNVILEFNGRCLTMQQWSNLTGIHKNAIHYRINHGWTTERALTEPSQRAKS